MSEKLESYNIIKDKIHAIKEEYPSLKNKSDDFAFSALAVKAMYYKNPALTLSDTDINDIIVDGKFDGGVDFLLSDPNSEASDLIIGQSKFYQDIKFEDAFSAISKMLSFYKDMKAGHYENDKKLYSDFGEMLFTHFGLSGPLVLSASAHMRHFGSKKYRVEIDLKPALDEKTLDKRLLADFDKHKNSDFINALGELLPKKIIPVVIEKSGIDPREKVNSITKAQRAALLRVLKAFPVEISGKRPIAEAIITTGGVSVREVSPKTMESKKLPHLYFAGEVLDVDAYTGGFNLQIAWSTGRLAGLSAAEEES